MLTCLTVWNERIKWFKILKENEEIYVFCILTEFFHQPEKLENHKNFSSDDMNKADLLRKAMECHCLD